MEQNLGLKESTLHILHPQQAVEVKCWELLSESNAPSGFCSAGVRSGIKTQGLDLALIAAEGDTSSAAVFTQNQFCAPPVIVGREHAGEGNLCAIIANSGNANCCTGEQGLLHAREMAAIAGELLGISPRRVLVASTGIIGHPLPIDRIRVAAPMLGAELKPGSLLPAATAILTTDLGPKQSSVRVQLSDAQVEIAGMTKGAGMVAPHMATVFAFFVTDARIGSPLLQAIFSRVISRSINRVTVDGDTSTNDTACIIANGLAAGTEIQPGTDDARAFEAGLFAAARDLARKLARGGEGANCLITVRVEEAPLEAAAEQIALCIANSPLVKTAVFGHDPNWGRVAMAAGRAGVAFDQSKVSILLQGVPVMRGGEQVPFTAASLSQALGAEDVEIIVQLGSGSAYAEAWTCDLSYEYVKINAEYHT